MSAKEEFIPKQIVDKCKYHLECIGELFRSPLITLVVRAPELDQGRGEGDFVLTTDELGHVIQALEHRQTAEMMTHMALMAKINGSKN